MFCTGRSHLLPIPLLRTAKAVHRRTIGPGVLFGRPPDIGGRPVAKKRFDTLISG